MDPTKEVDMCRTPPRRVFRIVGLVRERDWGDPDPDPDPNDPEDNPTGDLESGVDDLLGLGD
jgi:hypothetical protein